MDACGVTGSLLHYSSVIAMVGSAFIIFVWLWWHKALGLDEEAKYQMLDEPETSRDYEPNS